MRLWLAIVLAAVSCAALAEQPAVYDLHEWGVFEAPRNAEWSQLDMKAEWATLPEFFWKSWPTERLPYRGPVKKPVIHIYAEKSFRLSLTIKFAEGRPVVWWPAADSPATGIGKYDADTLRFDLRVGDPMYGGNQPAPVPPAVPAGHWIEKLRAVNSSMLYASGSYSRMGNDDCAENFVYYDGLMKAPRTPGLTRDGDTVAIKNPHAFDMLDVMVIENTEQRHRVSKSWSTLKAGESSKIELADADDKSLAIFAAQFVERLTAAGLTKEESASLEKIWHEGFFQRDGLLLMYRVPQDVYDKWLPLTAKPAPKKTVRVGLVCHSHMEPELDATLEKLIAQLDAERFEDREVAQKKITQIGGAAFPALQKHFDDKQPEIASRCRRIVESLDVRPAAKGLDLPIHD